MSRPSPSSSPSVDPVGTVGTDCPVDPVGTACRALDGDLGWGLGVVFRAYVRASGIAMADVPGGPRGFQVLAAVAGDRPGTQLALARRLGIDRTVMTYLLDDLQGAGLVDRCADPSDRRARRIVATPAGDTLLADLHRRLRQVEDDLLAAVGDTDGAAFRSVLQRLARGLDTTDPGSPPACPG